MQRIAEIMTREVATISPEDNIQRAAQLMDELNVGSLPVCDGNRVVGMITDRDITVRVTSAAESPENTKVREVMSTDVICCTEDQLVEDVMEQMGDSQVRRIPVLSRDSRELVGIVALGDLATKQAEGIDKTIAEISTPSEPERPRANP